MRDTNFKVGDRVRIREWEDMEKEYGLRYNYFIGKVINVLYSFTNKMKALCGRTATIKHKDGKEVVLDFDDKSGSINWTYSTDMIEKVKENRMDNFKIHVANEKERNAVLKKMEKNGIKWQDGDEIKKFPLALDDVWLFVTGKKLRFNNYDDDSRNLKQISVSDYLKDKNECIVIYRNGNSVIAKDKVTGKKAEAKCHPDDEFDFIAGAKLALERLSQPEKEKPKYFNGKVVCVERKNDFFTKWKIYEFKDGMSVDDVGDSFPFASGPIKSVEDLSNRQLSSKFMEIVE